MAIQIEIGSRLGRRDRSPHWPEIPPDKFSQMTISGIVDRRAVIKMALGKRRRYAPLRVTGKLVPPT